MHFHGCCFQSCGKAAGNGYFNFYREFSAEAALLHDSEAQDASSVFYPVVCSPKPDIFPSDTFPSFPSSLISSFQMALEDKLV